MSDTVLLTGATGFVGRELLWRLAREPGQKIVCFIRAEDEGHATARLNEVLEAAHTKPLSEEERSRVVAVHADLTRERFGLSAGRWDELAATVTRILHGAASVDWTLSLAEAQRINVEGTRRILELAEAASSRRILQRFDYVSTCYVCGKRRGLILEEDLDGSSGFFNSYEQTKFEAERLVRASGVPFTTFRLSMVVGDSRTGYASTFKVMYWPLKMISRGLIRVVPGDRGGVVDVVPVDYVCDLIETISADSGQRGKTFHVAAGPDRSSTIGEILVLASRAFKKRAPLVVSPVIFYRMIRPPLYLVTWGRKRQALKKGRAYVPYAAYGASFDTTQMRAAIESKGLSPPPVNSYFQTLIDYALASEWGKRRLHRGPAAATE